jgi:hypothetical protein
VGSGELMESNEGMNVPRGTSVRRSGFDSVDG